MPENFRRAAARSRNRLSLDRRLGLEQVEPRLLMTTLPAGFTEATFISGLSNPTAMEFAPDGRLFVTQQGGALRVVKNGGLLAAPFLSLTVDSAGERGLLGVAFDPNFATNNFIYVYYTVPAPAGGSPHNRVSRFTANGDVVTAGSEVPILDLNNLSGATNHNGGAIHFGPDGKLYVAVGENANRNNSQTLNNRLGKMLRINSDGSIPTDNPFYTTATGDNRAIWAMGLRNPFTFGFQPGTNRIFINDVGENTWEEINDGIAGSNYGWGIVEGVANDARFRDPLFAYPHSGLTNDETGIAIVGGAFYNAPIGQFPADYVGDYFFADLGHSWIRRYDIATDTAIPFASATTSTIVDLKVGTNGSLYYLARGGNGSVKIISFPSAATVTQDPASQSVQPGQTATFTVGVSGSPTITYQWQRNNVDIQGATGPTYTTPPVTAADDGASYTVRVTNPQGNDTSGPGILTVTQATIASRLLFYNNSKFDAAGNNDLAIAPDKSALQPGGTATEANYNSYSRGINGVMVDINNPLHTPTLADFAFHVGNTNTPASWGAGPAPAITVRPGAGGNASTRVELVWPDGAIVKQWLEVTVLPSVGLATADRFYFGNAIGDANGPTAGKTSVDANDEIAARQNLKSFLNPAPIDDKFDFNRDGLVNATDQILARTNHLELASALLMINPPAALALSAPSGNQLDAEAVAAALALRSDEADRVPSTPAADPQPASCGSASSSTAGAAERRPEIAATVWDAPSTRHSRRRAASADPPARVHTGLRDQ